MPENKKPMKVYKKSLPFAMADAAAALAAQPPSDEAAEQAKADDEQMDGAFAAAAFGGKVEAVFKAADDDEDDDDDEDEIEQESEPEVDKNEELQVALEKNYPYFALTICPANSPANGNHLLIPQQDKEIDLNWERLAISFAGQLSLQRHLQMGSRRFTIGLDSADGTSLQNIAKLDGEITLPIRRAVFLWKQWVEPKYACT